MKQAIGLLYLVFLTLFSFGQKNNRILPQFDFMQIDSLTNSNIAKHISDDNFVVVQTNWYVGLWQIPDDTNYTACENPFDMYILYKKTNTLYLQHIDNFGYFEPRQIDANKTAQFLQEHFETMKNEKLQSPLTGSEHQLVQKINISFFKDSLHFDLPSDYSKNKLNTRTFQYKFVRLLENDRKKHKKVLETRASVLRGTP